MTIETTKQLEALLKMLRKQGVYEATIDNITVKLGALPNKNPHTGRDFDEAFPEEKVTVPKFNGSLEPDKIDTDELTEEQKLFYSAKEEPGTTEQ